MYCKPGVSIRDSFYFNAFLRFFYTVLSFFTQLQLLWDGSVGNIDIMARKLTTDICWLKREAL